MRASISGVATDTIALSASTLGTAEPVVTARDSTSWRLAASRERSASRSCRRAVSSMALISARRCVESLPSATWRSMLRRRNSFSRVSASSSLVSTILICSFRKLLAESVSLRVAPRPDSTKIDTITWITRLAFSASVSR
jgi:hypothetical protein